MQVEYDEALTPITWEIELLDQDDNPAGAQATTTLEVGHAPGSVRGQPIEVPQQVTFSPLIFQQPGLYRFRIKVNDTEMGSVRFRVATLPNALGATTDSSSAP